MAKETPKVPHIKRYEPEEDFEIKIPICCREGHDDCPHVINKPKRKKKVNIAL